MNLGCLTNRFIHVAFSSTCIKIFKSGPLNRQVDGILRTRCSRLYTDGVNGRKPEALEETGEKMLPLPFGEHKGKLLNEVPREYLLWLLRNSRFVKKSSQVENEAEPKNISSPEPLTRDFGKKIEAELRRRSTNEVIMPYGKHLGLPLSEVPQDYLQHTLTAQETINKDYKEMFEAELKRRSENESWLPDRDIVRRAVESRKSLHTSGRIIKLDKPCSWRGNLVDIEKELGIEGEIYYVLFGDSKGTAWRVKCVKVTGTKSEFRKLLQWRGLPDNDLANASGIPDSIFVHASGKVGSTKTEEGALQMAIKSLEAEETPSTSSSPASTATVPPAAA